MLSRLLLACVLVLAAVAQPNPPFWGGKPQYKVNVVMTDDSPIMTWNFSYYYDSTIKAERYEHKAPQADEMCLLANPPYGVNDSCVVIFSDDGWSYIQYPQHNWCCKCENSFHYVNYEWLQENSTYQGITTINNYTVQHWTKQYQYLNHYYCANDTALPVRYFELKHNIPKAWDFDLKSYVAGPVDHKLFEAPCTNLCSGGCKNFRKILTEEEE